MKTICDIGLISSACIAIYGIYIHLKTVQRLDVMEKDINIILSTHNGYIEHQEKQIYQIKIINEILEQIALSTPFRGSGWQTKFIEAKVDRDLKNWKTPEERQDDYEKVKESRFFDDEE
jgi:hypothetical protein